MADTTTAKLVAVASQRQERAMQFAAKWDLNLWYTDYIEMIQKSDIDAIIINAPHHMHCPIALEAMRLGKHVLVDKPIATNLKEADEMIKEANRTISRANRLRLRICKN